MPPVKNTKTKKTKKNLKLKNNTRALTILIIVFFAVTTLVLAGKNLSLFSSVQGATKHDSGITLDIDFNSKVSYLENQQIIQNAIDNKPAGVLGINETKAQDPEWNPDGFFRFNGNEVINLDPSNFPKENFSIEVWVRSLDSTQTAYVISSDDSTIQNSSAGIKIQDKYWWYLGFNSGSKVYLPFPRESVDSGWHQIFITRDEENIAIYLDGEVAEIKRGINNYTLSNKAVTVGATKSDGNLSEFFKGDISRIRVYSKTLSKEEIQNYYSEFEYSLNNLKTNKE